MSIFYLSDAWLLTLFQSIKPQEICYKKFGCFKSEEPFTNTNGILPDRPRSLGVRYLLYTRRNPRKSRKLRFSGTSEEYLDVENPKPTKVIIHGYVDRGRKGWVRRMTREIIKNVSDSNFLYFYWFPVVTWLKYCRYGIELYPINQSTDFCDFALKPFANVVFPTLDQQTVSTKWATWIGCALDI